MTFPFSPCISPRTKLPFCNECLEDTTEEQLVREVYGPHPITGQTVTRWVHRGGCPEDVRPQEPRPATPLTPLCPTLPAPLPIGIPVAVVCEESAQAALQAIHELQEQTSAYRRFLRAGAAYRAKTGRPVPGSAWSFAHDEVERLGLQRQRVQEALGSYRRKREEAKRASFERAFVKAAGDYLEQSTFEIIAFEARSRGAS
ncbi:MAG: hypothetical protein Q8P41_31765 [Pseudomonadota bacterium]|nr:hypothetical protein [Pseudomonadota bacterium]